MRKESKEGNRLREGHVLSKLVLIVALAPLLTVTGYAADSEGTTSQERSSKITLNCSGTVWVKGLTKEGQAPIPSFVIDLDEGIVTSSLGEFSITELTPSRISFRAKDGETAWLGGVDRFSGDAIVTVQRNNEIVTDYKFTCKPTNPLF